MSLPIDQVWHFYMRLQLKQTLSDYSGRKYLTCVTCWIERGAETRPVDARDSLGPHSTISKIHQIPSFVFSLPVRKNYFITTCSTLCTDHNLRHKQKQSIQQLRFKTGTFWRNENRSAWAWRKKNTSVSQETDISPLSEQSHNTCSVPKASLTFPLPISHADCDSYDFRFFPS